MVRISSACGVVVALGSLALGGCSSGDPVQADPLVATVVITSSAPTLGALGRTIQLAAEARNAAGAVLSGHTFTWNSSNTATATVNGSGVVTAVANGTTQITAATAGQTSLGLTVTVNQVVATVAVSSAAGATADTLKTTGRTRQFTAAAADSSGNAMTGLSFTWASTTTAVATVGASTGLVTAGTTDGTTQIQATTSGVTGSRALVVRRFASTFTLTPTSASIDVSSGTQVFNGTATDSSGAALPITWVARPSGVATVSPASGTSTTATAVANGSTFIVMSAGTRADSAALTTSNQPAVVSFSSQVQPVFTQNCAVVGCHTGANPQGGLNLSSGQARAQLVNQPALGFSGATRVIPGNAEDSYLIRKLEGRSINGAQMPDGGTPLPTATIQTIRTWINQGALNN